MVLEYRTVYRVRAGLGLDIYGCSARESLLGVKRVRHYVDGLNRFESRSIHRIGAVEVGRTGAVDARIVAPAADSVEDDLHGSRWIGGEGASAGWRGYTRHHHREQQL